MGGGGQEEQGGEGRNEMESGAQSGAAEARKEIVLALAVLLVSYSPFLTLTNQSRFTWTCASIIVGADPRKPMGEAIVDCLVTATPFSIPKVTGLIRTAFHL